MLDLHEPDPRSDLALVLCGGGARAAYQVGFLRRLGREPLSLAAVLMRVPLWCL